MMTDKKMDPEFLINTINQYLYPSVPDGPRRALSYTKKGCIKEYTFPEGSIKDRERTKIYGTL